MKRRRTDLPIAIQIASAIGAMLLVVGIALLGTARLDRGTWGSLGDAPARMILLGLVVLLGTALANAVRGE